MVKWKVMSEKNIDRGSEWRKWDLHVHSPLSVVQNYGGDNSHIWEKFISDIESLPEEIKVLGINDYLFIDGYKKVLEYKHDGRLKNIDLILPVVEFRLRQFVGHEKLKKVNYHVIFADESILSPDAIEQQFLSQLYGKARLDPEHESNAGWAGAVNRESLEDLGEKIRNMLPKDGRSGLPSNFEIGFQNISFEMSSISNALGRGEEKNTYLENRFLTAIGKSEWSDFKWDGGSIADKKTIINGCDFVFVASKTPEEALASKNKLVDQKVNSRLLHCSDAHDYANSQEQTNKMGHCFSWIKADLTFEGLRQVIYEPEERLCIQQLRPDDNKMPAKVIDKVEYRSGDEQVEVFLNQNLNSVIGVRGSGKSTLLKNIVYCSDRAEFDKRLPDDKEGLFPLKDKDFRVVWSDGISCGKDSENVRKVLFLPQKYLGSKVYQGDGGSDSEINQFITSLLEENEGFSNAQEKIREIKVERSKEINNLIEELLLAQSNIESYTEDLKKHSGEEGLKGEIEKKNKKLKEIKESVSLGDDELEEYKKLIAERSDIENKISQYEKDIDLYDTLVKEGVFDANEMLEYGFSENERGKITAHIKERQRFSEGFVEKRKDEIDEVLKVLGEKKSEKDAEVKPIQEKINKNKEVEKIAEGVKKDNEELKRIHSILKNKEEVEKNIEEIKKRIISVYEKAVQSFIECIKDVKIEGTDDLVFDFETKFDERSFDDFLEKLNKNDVKGHGKRDGNVININQIFEKLLSGKIKINKPHELKDCLVDLFKFRYAPDYLSGIQNKEGVKLNDMSDGEKMTTLLTLIFKFDENGYPILIDQPEDDLDSTVISETISNFIKDQKKRRQIIMASHNANLVICSDSEEVLVASKQNGNFHYKTGSIENSEINCKIVEVLEGGEEAFRKRKDKLGIDI